MKQDAFTVAAIAILGAALLEVACGADMPTAPDGMVPAPTPIAVPVPTPVAYTCHAVDRSKERVECEDYGLGTGKEDPRDGPFLGVMVEGRMQLRLEQPHLFGARSQGWQVLDNREYQRELVKMLQRLNPELCVIANPKQTDETMIKLANVKAIRGIGTSWHYDHLYEGDGREPNEAGEFLAASCSAPWF